MKLDAPGGVADAKRLDAHGRAGEHGRVRRRPALVAVPLERIESRRERPDQRIVSGVVGHLDLVPADLGLPGAPRLPARGRGQQLSPQTDAEQGRAALEHVGQQRRLLADPAVRVALVDVHRAAERHHRVVAHGIGGRRVGLDAKPLVELGTRGSDRVGEDARPGVALMGDRQHAHFARLWQ